MSLTNAQRRHLTAILTLHDPAGRAPTREEINTLLFGKRRNTRAAVTRTINTLEARGYVTVTWSPAANDEVITPTNEGRNAL